MECLCLQVLGTFPGKSAFNERKKTRQLVGFLSESIRSSRYVLCPEKKRYPDVQLEAPLANIRNLLKIDENQLNELENLYLSLCRFITP